MISALNSSSVPTFSLKLQSTFSEIQHTTQDVFRRIKGKFERVKNSLDFRPLQETGNIIEGGIWAGFWGICAVFSGISLHELYKAFTVELPTDEKFVKIVTAVNRAFLDLVSLGGSTAYNLHWAHEAKILSLGQYAPLFKCLGYGASLVYNTVEAGSSFYNLIFERDQILNASHPHEKERHQNRLSLALMKLIGNVSLVAWAALGIATAATGFVVSSPVTISLLILGCVFSIGALFYQMHIETVPEIPRIPKINLP
jgi:hypothetical protein